MGAATETLACPEHGVVPPLWRPAEASYDALVEILSVADGFPFYLPWPLGAQWRLTDFGVVSGRASYVCVSGTSALDGPVDLMVVSEEAGIGLGGRWAGTTADPGLEIGEGPPVVRVRMGTQTVPLWPISTTGENWDRSVLAGEGRGRWLWLVLRPASALLMLLDGDWLLREVTDLGPAMVELPFGGPPPAW